MGIITTEELRIGYGDQTIVDNLSVSIPRGKITSIIGANGCGKSTLLKSMARILSPKSGTVFLDGKAVQKQSTRAIAKKMAVLPQSPEAPEGLTVRELVSYGRFPHQRGFGKLNDKDRDMIDWALSVTGMSEFADRPVDAMSGGQRQRVWIAMALAQETEVLILDEPTTYLDLCHQLEVLKLLEQLNGVEGRTILMVIHDINQAARFSDHIVALKQGAIVKEGTPEQVVTKDVLREVFDIHAEIVYEPKTGKPVCLTYDLLEASGGTTNTLQKNKQHA
ncbi:ABC transporter ATP-binding protein [Bacillus fonticola]|uniref:ABC transporter ATP-binding protein n=1 Tax=Bacillus fonticola TaxID=2728853 RepID=UPI001474F6D2|nr:ABC transporter ATP-binding protein [Bacillus fonticola]